MVKNFLVDLWAHWGGSYGWGAGPYGIKQTFVHNDPVNEEGGGPGSGFEGCGFAAPQTWGGGCATGTHMPKISHAGESILFGEGDVLVGAFYNMAYTVGALGDKIQMENQAYPYSP